MQPQLTAHHLNRLMMYRLGIDGGQVLPAHLTTQISNNTLQAMGLSDLPKAITFTPASSTAIILPTATVALTTPPPVVMPQTGNTSGFFDWLWTALSTFGTAIADAFIALKDLVVSAAELVYDNIETLAQIWRVIRMVLSRLGIEIIGPLAGVPGIGWALFGASVLITVIEVGTLVIDYINNKISQAKMMAKLMQDPSWISKVITAVRALT